MQRRLAAEIFGTFWLVLGGCGTAVLAGSHVGNGGVALAFGLSFLTIAYAVGGISGAHFNPAVTVGLWMAKRFEARDVIPYVLAQLIGAIFASGVLAVIARGMHGFSIKASGFAANGYGAHSPDHYGLAAGLVCEVVMTALFLIVILGVTSKKAPAGFAPIAIGLTLTVIHLLSIPVTNTSVNPARSTGPALFVGGWALAQLWAFWVAPIVGAVLAAYAWRYLLSDDAGERLAIEGAAGDPAAG
jgi:aquaporin Z